MKNVHILYQMIINFFTNYYHSLFIPVSHFSIYTITLIYFIKFLVIIFTTLQFIIFIYLILFLHYNLTHLFNHNFTLKIDYCFHMNFLIICMNSDHSLQNSNVCNHLLIYYDDSINLTPIH